MKFKSLCNFYLKYANELQNYAGFFMGNYHNSNVENNFMSTNFDWCLEDRTGFLINKVLKNTHRFA